MRVPSAAVANRIYHTWSFGVGDPDARHLSSVRYGLPFAGKRGRHVCQAFGGKYSHHGKLHYSVDFDLPIGYQVRCCRSGWVAAVRNDSNKGGPSRKYASMANYVQVLHKDNTVGCYMHFQQNGVTATVGKPVKRGQVLGFIGMTGFTSRPHVHFHVKKNGDYHAGTEWATVPFVFKGKTREGLVVKTGCWYRNDESGLAVKTGTMQKAVAVKKK